MGSAVVVVASNRASAGVYEDRTGPVIVAWLRERGHTVDEPVVVPDGQPVAEALLAAIQAGTDLVLTTGGTGISPTDATPQVTRPLLDYEVPGLADAVRAAGSDKVPTAILSRGVAGVAGRTLVVNLPGSTGGVRDGLAVLDTVLAHALDQLQGGGPPVSGQGPGAPRVARATVTTDVLSVAEHEELVADAAAGATVSFAGVVRDHDDGKGVQALDYSAHPTAAALVAEVAADVASRVQGVRALAVSHRVGPLAIGDVALACAVSADHRAAAFETCALLVDEVKARIPVWKRQQFADGTEEWVGSA